MTEWRPIVGFGNNYEISEDGSVRRGNRILRPYKTWKGYLAIKLFANGKGKARPIHQLVLEAFVGPRPPGFVACHNDGNKANNNVANLRWDSIRANHYDKIAHGTFQAGEKHGRARLTEEQVREVLRSPETGIALARHLGVSASTISMIRRGRSWRSKTATERAEMQLR